MRKANEDVVARSVAESKVAAINELNDFGDESVGMGAARAMVGEFKAVEFETTTRKVSDEEIHLRRLVLTGPWEVDPAAGR